MPRLFGTDGVRGEVNREPLLPGTIFALGRALATYWYRVTDKRLVVLGHDGRLSADLLQNLISAALQGAGFKVANLGLCSTPALSFLTRMRETAGGIMISASHNSFYDNGIKPFSSTGEKFSETQEEEVETLLAKEDFELVYREELGRSIFAGEWLSEYREALSNRSIFYPGRILVDCANGGTSPLAPSLLEKFCNSAYFVNTEPDGTNINQDCGSLNVENLKQMVRGKDADLGFAFDGDGDRVLAIDEKGEVVDGDTLMYMLASYAREKEKDFGGLIITVMSNYGLRSLLDEKGINYEIVDVGDRNVFHRLQENQWRLGGEQSGHIIDRDWLPTGDGLRVLVKILEILQAGDKKLYEWNQQVPEYPQVLKNFEVPSKPPLENLSNSRKMINNYEENLGEGRILVRYSGTEPIVRVMLEGKNEEQLVEYAETIGNEIVREICELEG